MTSTPTTHGTAPTPSQTPAAAPTPAAEAPAAVLSPAGALLSTDSRIVFIQQLAAVAVEMQTAEIAKKEGGSGSNTYRYATGASIIAAAVPALARRGIVIFPRVLSTSAELIALTGDNRKGWIANVEMGFVVTNGQESEYLEWRSISTAYDEPSKAIVKAKSIAYREALKKLFGITAPEDEEAEQQPATSRQRTASAARPAPSAGSQPAAAPAPAEHRQPASQAAEERAAAIAAAQAAADATGATLPALIERWSIASARRQTARKVEHLSNAELLIVAGWGAANPLAAAGAG